MSKVNYKYIIKNFKEIKYAYIFFNFTSFDLRSKQNIDDALRRLLVLLSNTKLHSRKNYFRTDDSRNDVTSEWGLENSKIVVIARWTLFWNVSEITWFYLRIHVQFGISCFKKKKCPNVTINKGGLQVSKYANDPNYN